MITIRAHEVTPRILALFDLTQPTIPRAFNVLEGTTRGRILVDDPAQPSWAVAQEATFGTLYVGGQLDAPVLANIVDYFRQFSDVGISCWPDGALSAMLPPHPTYDGRTLYFTQRSTDVTLESLMRPLPSDYALQPRDAQVVAQSFDYGTTLAAIGTAENILRMTHGVVVLHNDVVCCEAATGAPTHGRIEVGVTTAEVYRQRGFATSACAALIGMCEAQGYATWWDCAKQNISSIRLARKLGYCNEQEYRYVLWTKH